MRGNKGNPKEGVPVPQSPPEQLSMADIGSTTAFNETEVVCEGVTTPIDQAEAAGTSCYDVGFGQTIGSRNEQQDSLCYSNFKNQADVQSKGILLVVCDGIGGVSGGQRASQTAVRTMYEGFMQQDCSEGPADRLLDLTAAAHKAVLRLGEGGTTVVSCLIVGKMLYLTSVGDSRICLCRNGGLLTLNRTHVYGNMLNEGRALGFRDDDGSRGKANALTAFLGQNGLKQIDRTVHPLRLIPGDRLLLMSDGIFNTLSEEDILMSLQGTAKQSAECIIRRVEEYGITYQDNATILIASVQ